MLLEHLLQPLILVRKNCWARGRYLHTTHLLLLLRQSSYRNSGLNQHQNSFLQLVFDFFAINDPIAQISNGNRHIWFWFYFYVFTVVHAYEYPSGLVTGLIFQSNPSTRRVISLSFPYLVASFYLTVKFIVLNEIYCLKNQDLLR